MKQLLLSLLDKFVAVCEEYHMQYYLAAGSVLGAVRHKGLIPWDDDIDVYMPRADYEKLQTLPDEVWGEDMRLATWRKTKNYTYDFLKLELTNTTVIERYHPLYVGGVFLDVFPVDVYPSDKKIVSHLEEMYPRITNRYIESTIKNDCDCNSVCEVMRLHMSRRQYNHKQWMENWEREIMQYGQRGELMVDYHNYAYCHGGWSADYFGDGVLMEFEGRMCKVPTQWDAYLKHMYGDYMTPPPVEKRYAHHFDYVNYEYRLSGEELRDVVLSLKKKISYRFSIKRELKKLLRKRK